MGEEAKKPTETAPSNSPAGQEKSPESKTDATEARGEVVQNTKTELADLQGQAELERIAKQIEEAVPGMKDEKISSQFRRTLAQMVNFSRGIGFEHTAENINTPQFKTEWVTEISDILETNPTEKGLQEARVAFGKWLDQKGNEGAVNAKNMLALWKDSEAKRAELPSEAAFKSRLEQLQIDPKMTNLEAERKKLIGKINGATEENALQNLEAAIKTVEEATIKSTPLLTALNDFEKDVVNFSYGKTGLQAKLNAYRTALGAELVNTILAKITEINTNVEQLKGEKEEWKKINELAESPDLPTEKRDEILNDSDTENFDRKKAIEALEQAIAEIQGELDDSGEEGGMIGAIKEFLDMPFLEKIFPPERKAAILGALVGIAAKFNRSFPFIGKSLRGMFGDRKTLLEVASATGHTEFANALALEQNAVRTVRRYGIDATFAEEFIEMDVKAFSSFNSAKAVKGIKDDGKKRQQYTGMQALRNDFLKFSKTEAYKTFEGKKDVTLTHILGSQGWRNAIGLKTPPPKPKPAPAEEKTPEPAKTEPTPEAKATPAAPVAAPPAGITTPETPKA